MTGGNYINIEADIKDFTQKLKLKEKFNGQTFEDDSLVKKKSIYTPQTNNPDFQKIIDSIEQMEPVCAKKQDNFTTSKRKALEDLKSDANIIIKKADKGNTLVVMSMEFYRDKLVLHDHLNTPQRIVKPSPLLINLHLGS